MQDKLLKFQNILRSPITFEALQIDSQGQNLVGASGVNHACVNGAAVLVKFPREMHLVAPPPEKVSCNISDYKVLGEFASDARVLHLGSGNVPCSDPRVVSLDVLPCENVDVVGEAENLPFVDGCFDLVESGAVFEHLHDPIKAISEVRRVLKDGGVFRIDNSFMQGYHGFPSHYFNMTPQANETYLIDDFLLLDSRIPESGTPLMTLNSILDRFLECVPKQLREQVQKMPVAEFQKLMKSDLTSTNPLMKELSDFSRRSLAATHVLCGKKPDNYEARKKALMANSDEFESWQILKREYYTCRMEVMMRHHEIQLYKRFCLEAGKTLPVVSDPASLDTLLRENLLQDPFSSTEIAARIAALRRIEAELKKIRDVYVSEFVKQTAQSSAPELRRLPFIHRCSRWMRDLCSVAR